MGNLIQAVRGMNDILPTETPIWQYAENVLRKILSEANYQEIRLPILEKTELFKRTIGEVTDIVEKEMYTFLDRNQESLSLRPEGTASCVRAGIEHGLLYNQIQKLWYIGPFFRHERPQKGRYRQFHQFGAEIFGLAGPDIDAELILLSAYILEQWGLSAHVTLEINSLGTSQARNAYREQLVTYFNDYKNELDEDSQKRLITNPLRILDSKNPDLKNLIANAPKLQNYLDDESKEHFAKLLTYLDCVGQPYIINPCLVRGLDYYSKTVFEWVTHDLGAQGTVCAGGRYDDLVEQLGGKPTPALGFAIGLERIILLLQQIKPNDFKSMPLAAYVMTDSDAAFQAALQVTQNLRKNLPQFTFMLHCGGGSFKNQFKKADKSGALFALIIGEDELSKKAVSIKPLRKDLPQQTIAWSHLIDFFKLTAN